MHRTYGVIAIEGDMAYLERYGLAALHLFRMIVPYGELLEGSKISLSASGLSLQRQPKCGPANSPKTDPV
jgi:hypothetical protein